MRFGGCQNVTLLSFSRSKALWWRSQIGHGQRWYSQTLRLQNTEPSKTRNIGIIAHIDAGKTTTTERMLYYSGHTSRIGDVDDGSTVTDFLPAERARGITIQSAAITLNWPPASPSTSGASPSKGQPFSRRSHDINLIDTPGHADFTFEVLRSLRVLDGAICILDGVAGVEAQTEIVWSQASHYKIPRVIFVNKLDRDGASFSRSVREIASKLHVWPAVCQIPWWNGQDKQFCGIGDAIHLRALQWEAGTDGRAISSQTLSQLEKSEPALAKDIKSARIALVELLSEHDEAMVEHFLESNEDHLAIPSSVILESLRSCALQMPQSLVPVFAGASFRNIGVQPLMDAVVDLLPAPEERPDPEITIAGREDTLATMLAAKPIAEKHATKKKKAALEILPSNVQACALAFKVVHDAKRGVLVYVRVYHGQLHQGAAMFNTTLGLGERAGRILRMYASDAAEIDSIDAGHIGVIVGLKHTRTGDTLLCYSGMNWKTGPPEPINSLQLRPINIPPPVFFASIEPMSLSEEKPVANALQILLREDPSLHVVTDIESGQTHLSGMGELHLEIACDRLVKDLKAKATVGKIEIGYRESISATSKDCFAELDREVGGKSIRANCLVSVQSNPESCKHGSSSETVKEVLLSDNNILTIHHPAIDPFGQSLDPNDAPLPKELSYKAIFVALQSGATAGLARGAAYGLPVHSTNIHIQLRPKDHIFPETTVGAIAMASRQAIQAALKDANKTQEPVLLEPVMRATITVYENDLGSVVRDINSARGGTILSLGDDDEGESLAFDKAQSRENHIQHINMKNVYYPPDPFASNTSDADARTTAQTKRQIIARVPLKEMVGYLKHLRSLTGGRGTFLMQVDRFEPVRGQRLKATLSEIRGW